MDSKIRFTGFTYRDPNGVLISVDNSDWNFKDEWSDIESNLFSSAINLCNAENDFHIMAYPNPCTDFFIIQVEKDAESTISYRIVDEDFNIISSADNIEGVSNISIDLENISLSTDVLRVYYLISDNKCDYIGHGDIEIYR